MKTLREIVSLYKYEEGIYTDEAAASSLGCTKQAFSNYLRGDRRMPDVAIMKLAHGTGVSVDEIITAINLNLKTTDEHERSYWLERATDYAAVIAAVLIGVTAISPRNAEAMPAPANKTSIDSLYIMSTKVGARRIQRNAKDLTHRHNRRPTRENQRSPSRGPRHLSDTIDRPSTAR